MLRWVLSIIVFFVCAVALAQDQGEASPTPPADRKALLKDLVARDRGEITAIEPSSKNDGSVIIGYSSGAILICKSAQVCKEFDDTPSVPVEHIAVSKRGADETIWVTYRQGALYQCQDNSCIKFLR